jgi:anti-sigma B factor antagonist
MPEINSKQLSKNYQLHPYHGGKIKMSILPRVINKDLQVLKVDRPLSGRCADELEQKFADARSYGVKHVVVDLEDTAYIDSRGLAALVAGYKLFGSDKHNFRLAAPQDQPKLLFELTMFDRIFAVFDNVVDAVGVTVAHRQPARRMTPSFVSQPVT